VRRRGKDEGFHPHPGDPWHPGWAADEEPPPEVLSSGDEPEEEQAPSPEVLSAGEEPESAAAEVGGEPEPVAAEAGEEMAEWIEILGVAPDQSTAAPPAPGEDEGVSQTLFDWPAGQPPAGAPPIEAMIEPEPVESPVEPEHLPPPWSPDETPAEEEWVEAVDEVEPVWEGEAAGRVPTQPLSPPRALDETPAEEERAEAPPRSAQPKSPPTADETQEIGRVDDEAEVDDWLAFAAGPATEPAGLAAEAEPSTPEEAARAELGAVPVPPARRGLWSFGRRGRRGAGTQQEEPEEQTEEQEPAEPRLPAPPPWSPDEIPEETTPMDAQAAVVAGEAPAPRPPPGSPGIEPDERGVSAVESGSDATAADEAWGEVEPAPAAGGWRPPSAEPERAAAVAETEGESEEPPPPPWVIQSELDRAAAIPVVPPVSAEKVGEPSPSPEWGEPAGWEEEAEWARPAPAAAAVPTPAEERQREEAEAWEAFGGSAAPGEAPGAPAMEAPYPEADETRRATPGLIGEEIYTGAVTAEHRDLAAAVAAADTADAQMQAVSAPMAGLESGVVGFEDVVEQEGESEPAAPARSDLPLRVVTGLVLVGLLAGAIWVGGGLLAGFIGLLAFAGVIELYAALRRSGHRPLALFGILGAGGLLAATWFHGLVAIPITAIGIALLSFFYYTLASRRRDPLTNGSLTVLGVLWVAGPLAFAFPIVAAPHSRVLVIALVATVVATDVGAYFAGRSWGSRPLAPVLSPHKTVEGLAGGVVLGLAAAVLMGHFFEPLNLRTGTGLGLVVAVMAPLGDLTESMVKRSLGLKDMGSILPGHGGILDRVDAFLFVVPAVWVLYETLGLLR
jgi:phosphatidate cytidylyltransferase